MAIEKNHFKASRFDSEFSMGSRDSASSEEDELQRRSSAIESDEDDEFDDADSGAGSDDDFDLLELGETGAEFCQIGNQTCSIPFELYDLPGLEEVLSMDVWNECLSEEDRFNLAKYLPDIDQETFVRTLKELFTGCNFHFGSPITKLFDMLKGGLCEPRVALYRQGLNFFQKRQHYYLLQRHQNNMVGSLHQIRDAWLNCRGYSIEERLRVLNIMRSQKSLQCEKMEDMGMETDSSERESGEGLWSKRLKDRKLGQKMGLHTTYGAGPMTDLPSRGRPVAVEPAKYGKQNPKGTLRFPGSKTPSMKELLGHSPSVHHGLETKPGSYGSIVALSRQNKATGYDPAAALRIREHMRDDDDADETMYEMAVHRDRNVSRGGVKLGKKLEFLRGDEFGTDSFEGFPLPLKNDLHAYGKNRNVKQMSDIKGLATKSSSARTSNNYGKRIKYHESVQQSEVEDQMKSAKGRASYLSLKEHRVDLADRAEPFWHNRTQVEAFSVDPSFKYDDWNARSKKWKTGRESPDVKIKSYRTASPQMSDRLLHSEYRTKPSEEKIRGSSSQNGGSNVAALKGVRMFVKSEETESDSSEQVDEEADNDPLMRSKLAYPTGVLEGSRTSFVKSGLDPKKVKFINKNKKESTRALDGIIRSTKKMGDLGEHLRISEVESYSSKVKQKGKMRDTSHLHSSEARLEDSYFSGSGQLNDDDDRKQTHKLGKSGHIRAETGERLHMSSSKAYSAERRQKLEVDYEYPAFRSNYLHVDERDNPLETRLLADDGGFASRLGRKNIEAFGSDNHERFDSPSLGYNSASKKRKGKEGVAKVDGADEYDYLHSNPQQQIDESTYFRKRGKRKLEDDGGSLDMGTSETPITEMGATDLELDTKPQKKPFTLITPTVHTGFSFSIVHLLSAVRMAMITPLPEDSLEVGRQKPSGEQSGKQDALNGIHSHENVDINNPEHSGQLSLPSLTVQEIVNRVRSNPGDPCILETQEPLQDLVRGVLKIFSSKTAPLGAKGWKALVFYEKSTKSWSWIGPVSQSSLDHETIEEVTSPEAWGLPHKMLVKLVDSFANWLKSGQETLQQIGSLPPPPVSLMQFNLDEKERFRDLRAQKSLTTISPSSEEVRAYFRKEEVLRYSVPDRAFSYTAADGRKSIVAPLRRCGGKPTSKARDHFLLKRDRPPHVTILCLVRDAAARLPGSIGTRADVCTLIRDSQYIVEDVPDSQVNQIVSGALDRLHYERDPCVQFDGERKLWVYLHREREEEDFEDDGTSSTKKWKRQKKDTGEQFDQGTVTVAYHGAGEQTGFDLSSDLNVEPSSIDDDKRVDPVYDNVRQNVEDNVETDHGAEQGNLHGGQPVVWEAIALNPMRENKLLCQENSTNEDFDDETFGRERTVGLLSASLL